MSRFLEPRLVRRIDWSLLFFVAAIVAISLPTIYSASLGGDPSVAWHYVKRQLAWFALGGLGILLLNSLDHHDFPDLCRPLYYLGLLLLVLVMFIGREVNGAKSWFELGPFRLQPSEFCKLTVILCLAKLFSEPGNEGWRWSVLLRSAVLVGVPMLLILAQPDLGTTLTFVGLWLLMLWWAGGRWWQIGLIIGLGLAAFALMWQLDVLADYQKARILVLFDPSTDPRGQGYNLRQSLIAVGSGGLTGQGWLQGTQTHLRFLPERHTDFIFAVLCEEFGLVGGVTLLALYAALAWRGLLIVARADSAFGRSVAVGCVGIIVFHVALNVGMVLGLLPITGLPLPFFSYGGSNLLTNMALIGLLINIGMRRGGINY